MPPFSAIVVWIGFTGSFNRTFIILTTKIRTGPNGMNVSPKVLVIADSFS